VGDNIVTYATMIEEFVKKRLDPIDFPLIFATYATTMKEYVKKDLTPLISR
jgi:hypothetical protein